MTGGIVPLVLKGELFEARQLTVAEKAQLGVTLGVLFNEVMTRESAVRFGQGVLDRSITLDDALAVLADLVRS